MKKIGAGSGDVHTDMTGFTLVELLVVITILAVISVVAYTSFGGVTDKAKNSSKLDHIASIEGGLNTFYSQNNYYPMPSVYDVNTNVWGYNSGSTASQTATFIGSKTGDQITSASGASIVGGGKISVGGVQIGAKGVIDSSVLGKQYLSQDLYDPALKDIKVGNDKTFKDFGIGKYIYAVYSKFNDFTATSKRGSAYNIAATLFDEQKGQVAKVSGNFDKSLGTTYPDSLIGSGTSAVVDGGSYSGSEVSNGNLAIPYPITGF